MLPRKQAREDAEGEIIPLIKLAEQASHSTTEEQIRDSRLSATQALLQGWDKRGKLDQHSH